MKAKSMESRDLKSQEVFDFATFYFPEFLISTMGRDGRFPAWAKCISLGVLLYVAGAVSAYVSGSFVLYPKDYGFLTTSLLLGITLGFLTNTLRGIQTALVFSNKRLHWTSADKRSFDNFVVWMQGWSPVGDSIFEKAPFWYYLETFGGGLIGSLIAVHWSYFSGITFWGASQYWIASVFFIVWYAVVGYITGASVFITIDAIRVLREYCKRFISAKKIVALNPDRVGGLKPFGKISLNLDIALALPSTVLLAYIVMGLSPNDPVVVLILTLYTLLLMIAFFVPISPAHNAMVNAKELAFEEVNRIFLKVHSTMSNENEELDPKVVANMNDVHLLHQRISKMAVWPLDWGTILKFTATVLYPFVGGLIVTYITKSLGLT